MLTCKKCCKPLVVMSHVLLPVMSDGSYSTNGLKVASIRDVRCIGDIPHSGPETGYDYDEKSGLVLEWDDETDKLKLPATCPAHPQAEIRHTWD